MPKRYTTSRGYMSYLRNWVLPKWGTCDIRNIKAMDLDAWFESLPLAAKSKTHVKLVMARVFDAAMLWEFLPYERNPLSLIRSEGGTKRETEPKILTPDEFDRLLAQLPDEPYRTILLTVMCLGLRCSELVGLQWSDFDWDKGTVLAQRGVCAGRADLVKTSIRGNYFL